MHELALPAMSSPSSAMGRRVRPVNLEVGKLSGVIPDAIEFCFETVAQGTLLKGATLEIRQIEGRARCGAEFATETLFTPCACGSRRFTWLQGEELNIKSMELEEEVA
jgi:hydrogenase nickel incorporation protein HypA/HybF